MILPEATSGTEPSWFGFPITLRDDAPFTRDEFVVHLNEHKIVTRLLFGANRSRQPYMKGRNFRIHGSLENSDRVVDKTFWVGVYPGSLGEPQINYMLEIMSEFCHASGTRRRC